MKKVSSKKLVGILCLLLVVIIGLVGCGTSDYSSGQVTVLSQETSSKETVLPDQDGNPYSTHKIVDGETIVEYDYSQAYEKLDLSQYTEHGKFGEDGVMWVKKSDYTGIQYGYIDYNGNVIMALTSGIEETTNFEDGFAIIKHKKDYFGYPKFSIIDKVGKILFDCYSTGDIGERVIVVNKNIVIAYAMADGIDINSKLTNYIFFNKTNKLVKLDELKFCSLEKAPISISDGLIRIATCEEHREAIYYKTYTIQYFDENGELVLKIDNNSNENYKNIQYVENFVDGNAVLTFEGKDENLYTVTIDKQGEWQDEPKMIQKSSAKSF